VTRKFTIGKEERLKSRKAIEQLFSEGLSFHLTPFRVNYLRTVQPGLRFGTGVSRKHFPKAVDRNRVKRLSREAWRLQKIPLQERVGKSSKGLQVFLTYTGKVVPDYRLVYEATGTIIDKLIKKTNEDRTPDT
jgi:ribonuclease P protein component